MNPFPIRALAEEIAGRNTRIFPHIVVPLDLDPPELTFEPKTNTVLMGEVFIDVIATDWGRIEEVVLEMAPRAAERISLGDTSINTQNIRTLHTRLDTTRVADGPLALSAFAVDRVGNRGEGDVVYFIDNHPPEIVVNSPQDEDTINGEIVVRASAEDIAGLETFTVRLPTGNVEQGIRQLDGTWTIDTAWDSNQVPDGRYDFLFEAEDIHGHSLERIIEVDIDNIGPGTINGAALMDSPVIGLEVEAFALTRNGLGDRLDLCTETREARCITDEAGDWSIDLVDNYVGPVVIIATSPQDSATYIDAATGEEAHITDRQDLRTWALNYRPGETIDGMIISAATTLMVDWMLIGHEVGAPVMPDVEAAFVLWSDHLCPLGEGLSCDPTQTRPLRFDGSDVVAPAAGDARLGLFQVALSRRAADIRLRRGNAPMYGIGLLKRLRRDMQDRIFDGALNEAPIRADVGIGVEPLYLNACTLRSGLALAAAGFLSQVALADIDVEQRNGTELNTADFAEFLNDFSQRTGELWGDSDACTFDDEDPVIVVHSPDDGLVVGPSGGPNAGDWKLHLSATITDNSEVAFINVTQPDRGVTILNPDPEHFLVEIDYEDHGEVNIPVQLEAVDIAGNTTEVSLTVTVDLTPPEVELHTTLGLTLDDEVIYFLSAPLNTTPENPLFTARSEARLGFTSDQDFILFSGQVIELEHQPVDPLRHPIPWWSFGVHINPGLNEYHAQVHDLYGNWQDVAFFIYRDAEGPSINFTDTEYHPENQLEWQGQNCRLPGEACELIAFNLERSEVQTITRRALTTGTVRLAKFYDNWNGEITGAPNNASIAVVAHDDLGDYEMSYRVLHADICGECTRNDAVWEEHQGWRPMPGEGRRRELPLTPGFIEGLDEISQQRLLMAEIRVNNRTGRNATIRGVIDVRLYAPPISIVVDEDWLEAGNGVGAFDFERNNVLNTCGRDGIKHGRLIAHNPWPYDVSLSISGRSTAKQYNRRALRKIRELTEDQGNCGIGQFHQPGSRLCFNRIEDLDNAVWPRRLMRSESLTFSPTGLFLDTDDGIPRRQRGRQDLLTIPSGQSVEIGLNSSRCSLPFLLEEGTPTTEASVGSRHRIQRLISRRARPRRYRGIGLDTYDEYSVVDRVSRLDIDLNALRISLYSPADNAAVWRYLEPMRLQTLIDNPRLQLPAGYEGEQ